MDTLLGALVPGMQPAAVAAVAGQAQGIPLFAVETVRSLIDRDMVSRSRVSIAWSATRSTVVPDSLHALLAARLDRSIPSCVHLVADAAVLGISFSAEALVAVSGQQEAGSGGADRFSSPGGARVSADPLSPRPGRYQFAQHLLRQVAYETLVAPGSQGPPSEGRGALAGGFAEDGEEVSDVIARHYLDALDAVPDAPDTAEIRGQAITALIRAAERAERTGARALAADQLRPRCRAHRGRPRRSGAMDGAAEIGLLWEHAANAALTNGGHAAAFEHADRARDHYLRRGDARAAAGAQAIAGDALRQSGRLAESRELLTAALEVLRADPDKATVNALEQMAAVAVFAGSADADELSAEACILGQALGVDSGQLGGLLLTRGIYLTIAERRTEAIAYYREAAQLTDAAGNYNSLGRVLLNLADALAATDHAAAAEAARAAAGHLRRTGARDSLAWAITNLVAALMVPGAWDAADEELTRAVNSDGLGDHEFLGCSARAARRAARRRRHRREHARGAAAHERQRGPAGSGADQRGGSIHRGRAPSAGGGAPSRPGNPGQRRRPRDRSRNLPLGVAAGRTRRPRPRGCRGGPRTAGPARLLPARVPAAHDAGRARSGPGPACRQRRRSGCRCRVQRRHQRHARAEHPLPPRPWPPRPRWVPHPLG